ncbi:CRISPR-associated endonuclease Cas1 [Novosphingobium sediminicola]|uniref:CRISPR-associated endonuclease Cas1 n=1 Tax=Novosphingobium sediminicola TaxID=563162 RepID=A0A7W6CGV3_9SPHN|nr:CRISPR-associated endonuclease Cas1 [Novosphingobium sediminicola]MBB3956264.1 CRISPR-associated endonuclease Cas1 [Novosphingobium sediminicola]
MLENTNFSPDATTDEWASRSEFWLAECGKLQRKRRIRDRNTTPLILTGHGTSLRIEAGSLVIRQGFTHYPQAQEVYRFFRGELSLPPIIILLDGSGSLSFDVLNWLGEQSIALARITADGGLAVMASGAGFAANSQNLRWQFDMQRDNAKRIEFARDLITRKLVNSIATLQAQFPGTSAGTSAITKARATIDRLKADDITDMNMIRAIEGVAANAYWAAWAGIELHWTAQTRYPVPAEWLSYRSRSSILTGHKSKNRKASHPINAMLNYAYAVRAAQLQIQAVADGFDPNAGIMHHYRDDFPAYVYDLIEPERPKVDNGILTFARNRSFSGADFIIRKDGACRLSPQLARIVATVICQG